MSTRRRTLILAWGNPGRLDDGLGPALANIASDWALPGVTIDAQYQLQVEDAEAAARYERVVFVDADRAGPAPFSIKRLRPGPPGISFSSHSVTPGGLLALTRELYGREPEAWLLGIRGYDFDRFEESLSAPARHNLEAAADFVAAALAADRFGEYPPVSPPCPADRTSDLTRLEGAS